MTPAQACQCPPKYRGNAAGAPAGDFVFDQSAVQSERLETGPQGTGNVIAVAQDAADWATHRGNLERTASASVSVPSDVNKIAHFTPAALYVSPNMSYDFEGTAVEFRNPDEPEYLPTPPVIVGAYVFWGGADGMVRCYDLAAQEQVWSAPTGGCIFATPTVSEGRVYVGSGDGWAYCFEATTGRLLWRFRGAPTDRRIMYYGHLIGTWPTNTGVLVENGVAYLGNGLVERMGSHFYALDAATGTIKWQNNRTGIAYDADGREGHIPAGYLSLRDGTLWARCYTGPDAAFDIADGSLRQSPLRDDWPWYTSGGKNRSYDIGFVGDRFIYTGGRPREWDHCQRGSSRGDYFILQEIDATGKRLYPTIVLRENSCLAPAWDSAAIVLADDEATRLECWDMTKFVAYAAQLRSDSAAAYGAGRSSKSHTIRNPAIPYDGLRLWNDTTLDMNAVVLSSNAVVITHRTRPDRDSPWTWRLSVRDKTTGAAIWEQVLPSEWHSLATVMSWSHCAVARCSAMARGHRCRWPRLPPCPPRHLHRR